jgi:hypothetical protein
MPPQECTTLSRRSTHSMNPVVLFMGIASPLTCHTRTGFFSQTQVFAHARRSELTLIGLLATGLLKRHDIALPISA